MAPVENKQRPLFSVTLDGIKNLSVVLSVAVTLFGVIKFGVAKISEYDSHAARIAKLEARESAVHSLVDGAKLTQMQMEAHKADITQMKTRIDGLSNDIVNLRLADERMRTLLEGKKR